MHLDVLDLTVCKMTAAGEIVSILTLVPSVNHVLTNVNSVTTRPENAKGVRSVTLEESVNMCVTTVQDIVQRHNVLHV